MRIVIRHNRIELQSKRRLRGTNAHGHRRSSFRPVIDSFVPAQNFLLDKLFKRLRKCLERKEG